MSSARRLLLAILLPGLAGGRTSGPLPVQTDVGSFSILREGVRVGREQFSIRPVGSVDGVAFELRAESAIDERRLATRLEVDAAGAPLRYTADVRRGTAAVLRLGGQRTRGRFATLARTERGEAAREYLLPAGAVILEVEAFHQAALLLLAAAGRTDLTLRALAPMENRERPVRLTRDAASDTVTVAGVRRPAARWVVDDAGDRRVLWADAEGRILRVTVPARGLEAIRDDIPR
jgi:hypothetical protein